MFPLIVASHSPLQSRYPKRSQSTQLYLSKSWFRQRWLESSLNLGLVFLQTHQTCRSLQTLVPHYFKRQRRLSLLGGDLYLCPLKTRVSRINHFMGSLTLSASAPAPLHAFFLIFIHQFQWEITPLHWGLSHILSCGFDLFCHILKIFDKLTGVFIRIVLHLLTYFFNWKFTDGFTSPSPFPSSLLSEKSITPPHLHPGGCAGLYGAKKMYWD